MSEWVPYEGPKEGEGWQRVSDGEVRYTEDPPGEVADGYEDMAENWGDESGRTMSDSEIDIRGVTNVENLEETFRRVSENGTDADLEAALEFHNFRQSEISDNFYTGTVDRQKLVAEVYEYEDGKTFEQLRDFQRWMDDKFGFNGQFDMDEVLDQNAYEAAEEDFWREEDAYHATGPESAAKIITSGQIESRSSTRGTHNRDIGDSVFLSTTGGDWLDVYGAVQFEVDVQEMKEDDFTPSVEPEPAVAEARNEEMLAREMGFFHHQAHIPHDADQSTAIMYEDIPLKYLSLQASDKEIDDIESELETLEQRGEISTESMREAREWLDQQRESDEEKSKSSPTEKAWIPYEGPMGGEGWQNTENPDDVRYQDEPPGEIEDGYEEMAEGWGENDREAFIDEVKSQYGLPEGSVARVATSESTLYEDFDVGVFKIAFKASVREVADENADEIYNSIASKFYDELQTNSEPRNAAALLFEAVENTEDAPTFLMNDFAERLKGFRWDDDNVPSPPLENRDNRDWRQDIPEGNEDFTTNSINEQDAVLYRDEDIGLTPGRIFRHEGYDEQQEDYLYQLEDGTEIYHDEFVGFYPNEKQALRFNNYQRAKEGHYLLINDPETGEPVGAEVTKIKVEEDNTRTAILTTEAESYKVYQEEDGGLRFEDTDDSVLVRRREKSSPEGFDGVLTGMEEESVDIADEIEDEITGTNVEDEVEQELRKRFSKRAVDKFYQAVSDWKQDSATGLSGQHAQAFKQALDIDSKTRGWDKASREHEKIAEVMHELTQRMYSGEFTAFRGMSRTGFNRLMDAWIENPDAEEYELSQLAINNYSKEYGVASKFDEHTALIQTDIESDQVAFDMDYLAARELDNESEIHVIGDDIEAKAENIEIEGVSLADFPENLSRHEHADIADRMASVYGRRMPVDKETHEEVFEKWANIVHEENREVMENEKVLRNIVQEIRKNAKFVYEIERGPQTQLDEFGDEKEAPVIELTDPGSLHWEEVSEPPEGLTEARLESLRNWRNAIREEFSTSTEKEWIPYEGPQGGEGWQNTEDREDIRYDLEEPPGEVAEGYEDIAEDWGSSSGTDFDPYEEWGQEWEETVTHDMMSEDGDEVVERTADFLEEKTDVETVRFRNLRVEHMEKVGNRLGTLDSEFDLSGIEHFGDFGDLQNNFQTDDVAGYFMTEEDPNAFSYGQQVVARPMSFREPRIMGVDNEAWTVTNCRYQTPVHEVAHYLHFQEFKEAEEDPHRAWERYYDGLESDEEELLEEEVSKYGATNAFEAVAEIATGLMYGKDFSEEVMQIYEEHNGPDVPDLGFEEQPWDEDVDYPATLKEDEENPYLAEAEIVLDTFREWAGVDESRVTEKVSEAEWIPYEGPNGGEGWQNASDPEDVRYQEYPPGQIAEGYEEMAAGWGDSQPNEDTGLTDIPDPESEDEFDEWVSQNAYLGQTIEVASKQSDATAEFTVSQIDTGSQDSIKLRAKDGESEALDARTIYLGDSPYSDNMRYEVLNAQSFSELDDERQVEVVNRMIENGPAYENIDRDDRDRFIDHTQNEVSQQFEDNELFRRTIHSMFLVRNRADRASLRALDGGSTRMKISEDEEITTINHEYGHAILSGQSIDYLRSENINRNLHSDEKYRRRPTNLSNEFEDLKTEDWGYIPFDFSDDSEYFDPEAYMLSRSQGTEKPIGFRDWRSRQERLLEDVENVDLFDREWDFVSDDQTAAEAIEEAGGEGIAASIALSRGEDDDFELNRVYIESIERDDEGNITWLNLQRPNGGSWGYGVSEDGTLDSSNGSYLQAVDGSYEHDEDSRTVATQDAETAVGQFVGMKDPEDLDDKVDNLVSAVNRAWYKSAKLCEDDQKFDMLSTVPDTPYAATNAHEMFAEFHEMMQNEDRDSFIGVMKKQPWLTAAYMDLFEPTDTAKEAIRQTDLLQDIGIEP